MVRADTKGEELNQDLRPAWNNSFSVKVIHLLVGSSDTSTWVWGSRAMLSLLISPIGLTSILQNGFCTRHSTREGLSGMIPAPSGSQIFDWETFSMYLSGTCRMMSSLCSICLSTPCPQLHPSFETFTECCWNQDEDPPLPPRKLKIS